MIHNFWEHYVGKCFSPDGVLGFRESVDRSVDRWWQSLFTSSELTSMRSINCEGQLRRNQW